MAMCESDMVCDCSRGVCTLRIRYDWTVGIRILLIVCEIIVCCNIQQMPFECGLNQRQILIDAEDGTVFGNMEHKHTIAYLSMNHFDLTIFRLK